jgi:multidrug resistance efflux pump
MHTKSIFSVLVLVLFVGIFSACSSQADATPEAVQVSAVQQPKVVSAEAYVFPIQSSQLSFETGGKVISVDVKEGDTVTAGAVLAKLDDAIEAAQVAQAEANVSQAEAGLAEAAARVAEAQANLSKVKAPPTQEEIDQLQANLDRSQAVLAELLAGPTAEDIAQAEAAVRTAQARLAELVASARDEDLKAVGAQLLQTQADVREAQQKYDAVRYGDPDDVLVVGVALEKATLAYESAQANYDKLVNGATKEQVEVLKAQIAEANAALAKAKAGATPEQIAQAQADIARTEAELARLIAGATDEDIAIAEAQVETAQAGVESVRANIEASKAEADSANVQLAKRVLTAPFDGQVGQVQIDLGQTVQAGAPAFDLGDTGVWQIETDDLTEIDVVDVQPGAKVSISVDALPGETYEGVVSNIYPKSETKAGDVTYTVVIDITSGNTSRLHWGMTTFVDIEADSGIPR